MFYVYILLLSNNKFYTGYTENLKRRIQEHTSSQVRSTQHLQPIRLVHYEAYTLKSDAQRRERFLKTTEGKRYLKKQIRDLIESLDEVG